MGKNKDLHFRNCSAVQKVSEHDYISIGVSNDNKLHMIQLTVINFASQRIYLLKSIKNFGKNN